MHQGNKSHKPLPQIMEIHDWFQITTLSNQETGGIWILRGGGGGGASLMVKDVTRFHKRSGSRGMLECV